MQTKSVSSSINGCLREMYLSPDLKITLSDEHCNCVLAVTAAISEWVPDLIPDLSISHTQFSQRRTHQKQWPFMFVHLNVAEKVQLFEGALKAPSKYSAGRSNVRKTYTYVIIRSSKHRRRRRRRCSCRAVSVRLEEIFFYLFILRILVNKKFR